MEMTICSHSHGASNQPDLHAFYRATRPIILRVLSCYASYYATRLIIYEVITDVKTIP